MSERPARRSGAAAGSSAPDAPGADDVVVRAGCGRTRTVPAADVLRAGAPAVWAYVALAFDECATCPHRVDPEGVASFCAWRPEGAPHPFAALAGWDGAA